MLLNVLRQPPLNLSNTTVVKWHASTLLSLCKCYAECWDVWLPMLHGDGVCCLF